MRKIKQKIETIVNSEEKSRFFSFGSFLFGFSLLYGGVVKLREIFYKKGIFRSKQLPCKVISVGNLTAGGTGKTPMTIYMAELLTHLGYKVAVISRGYKGRAEKTGGVVSDGRTLLMSPEMAGDEPFMMAEILKDIPVVVGQNRFEAGMLAVKEFKPDVIVLDDAFQHLKLARDINLVLLDSRRPFGNTHLLPRGPLREPLSALLRGHGFILTRSDVAESNDRFSRLTSHLPLFQPVFRSSHIPYIYKVIRGEETENLVFPKNPGSALYDDTFLKGRNVFAFSGIARNNEFQHTIQSLGAEVVGSAEFLDHHHYSDDDFHAVFRSAEKVNAEFLVTTEKDYARIAHRITWPIDLVVIGIKISFGDEADAFAHFINKKIVSS